MINDIGRRERYVVVTILTDVGRVDMRGVFACGIRAVVAADAIVRDVHVIEVRRNPCIGRVAVVAIVTARDMRRMLARCCGAVVTGRAGPDDVRVIDCPGRLP